ncbi:MAG: aldolase/citrate lyase family protein [Pseudomonadota bacterium]
MSLSDLLERPGLKVGTYIGEFATPGIGGILASAGCEFAFVDMEHSGFGFETAGQVLRNVQGAGLATFLRVPSDARHHVQRAADIGAEGVILPMVGSAEQARAAVAALKYPPEGERGVILGVAHDDYQPQPIAEAFAAANRKTCLVPLIETAEGVENCDAICAEPGVDAIWIGHLDLSSSLGIPGAFESSRFTEAVTQIMHSAKTHGVAVGQLVNSADDGAACYRQGSDLICYSGDVWLLRQALADGLAGIRAKLT